MKIDGEIHASLEDYKTLKFYADHHNISVEKVVEILIRKGVEDIRDRGYK